MVSRGAWSGSPSPWRSVRVLGVLERAVAVERVDRSEAGVAGPDAVPSVSLRWARNAPISGASRSSRSSWKGCLAGPLVRELEQQPERVAICGDRLRAAVALVKSRSVDHALQDGAQAGSWEYFGSRSSRWLTRAIVPGRPPGTTMCWPGRRARAVRRARACADRCPCRRGASRSACERPGYGADRGSWDVAGRRGTARRPGRQAR